VKKSNKKFQDFWCHHNPQQLSLHYSENILGNKGLHSVSNKTNCIKIGLQLFNIHGHSWIEELQTRKPLSSSSISRKRQDSDGFCTLASHFKD